MRDLIRDLRAAPEFGLLFHPPPIRERLFKIIQDWVYAARMYPIWREEYFLSIVQTAIEELRNHYWASQGIPIENLQLKLHKDDDAKDALSVPCCALLRTCKKTLTIMSTPHGNTLPGVELFTR